MARGYGITSNGRQPQNEDGVLVVQDIGLYGVADGLDHDEGGAVASSLALGSLQSYLERNASADDPETMAYFLDSGLRMAYQNVVGASQGPLERMSTTITVLWLKSDFGVIAHVGDSRVYRLRDGELRQLTKDHRLAQVMTHATDDPFARFMGGALTRSLSTHADPTADIDVIRIAKDDLFLLCTAGVSDTLNRYKLEKIMTTMQPSAQAEAIVHEAFDQGGMDNTTAIVVEV